jgi:hypothetical protein
VEATVQHLFEGTTANNIEFLGIKFINVGISNKRKQEQKEKQKWSQRSLS